MKICYACFQANGESVEGITDEAIGTVQMHLDATPNERSEFQSQFGREAAGFTTIDLCDEHFKAVLTMLFGTPAIGMKIMLMKYKEEKESE